jgi:hypothetical protein
MPRPICDVNGPEYQALLRARIFSKARETAESHTTTHYIWRTWDDDKVRPEHAANNGKIFAWDNPPPTGNPGETFGCRCWAEPYGAELREYSSQVVTFAMPDATPAWTREDFIAYYFVGGGQEVSLSLIGLLQNVIGYARTYSQPDGGSIFDRVASKIFIEAREKGEGSFESSFGRSYDLRPVRYEFGDATIEGIGRVNVVDKGDFLIVTAYIDYNFYDRFTDPLDEWNVIPGVYDLPGATPYDITDVWSTHLEALIKKNSSTSRFPNDEFEGVLPG